MIIGFLFTIKGAFNILKGLNYFIFKKDYILFMKMKNMLLLI